jgi:hypothetical protein
MKPQSPTFPRLNQRQVAAFLGIKTSRLEWAGKEGIIQRDDDGFYRPELVTGQWLKYERSRNAKGERRSVLERERARLTGAKAEAAERKLAMLDQALVGSGDIIERARAVCLRIKSKLQAALPRLARGAYYAPDLTEALFKVRSEFDLLIAELSALSEDESVSEFEVVTDEGNRSVERSAPGQGSDDSAG